MKWIDLPPVWLLVCLVFAWLVPWSAPWGTAFVPGFLCLFLAAGLVLSALTEFRRARTTPIPHREPSALITTGVFRFSRNPIYLADLLILLGFSLIWGSLFGLLLLPALWAILEVRFIHPEEARLHKAFQRDFEGYAKTARRWI